MQHIALNVDGKRGREALNVHLLGVLTDRLNEELMSLLVGKARELVLDRGAISRARTVYLSRIHR